MKGLTHARSVITLNSTEVVLAGEHEDWVSRAVSFLRPLDPVRADLDRKLASWRTKRGTVHATTELVARLDNDEVSDSLLCQLARCDNACNASPKDEHLFGLWF